MVIYETKKNDTLIDTVTGAVVVQVVYLFTVAKWPGAAVLWKNRYRVPAYRTTGIPSLSTSLAVFGVKKIGSHLE